MFTMPDKIIVDIPSNQPSPFFSSLIKVFDTDHSNQNLNKIEQSSEATEKENSAVDVNKLEDEQNSNKDTDGTEDCADSRFYLWVESGEKRI